MNKRVHEHPGFPVADEPRLSSLDSLIKLQVAPLYPLRADTAEQLEAYCRKLSQTSLKHWLGTHESWPMGAFYSILQTLIRRHAQTHKKYLQSLLAVQCCLCESTTWSFYMHGVSPPRKFSAWWFSCVA